MVLNSESTIDPEVHHEYLHLIDGTVQDEGF